MHIVTACTANICRSPFVQMLLAERLNGRATVSSGGVTALVGEPMDPRTRHALAQRGLDGRDVDRFRASALTESRIAGADLVLTATRTQRDEVVRLTPRALKRTFTLLEFAELAPQVTGAGAGELIAEVARIRSRLEGPTDVVDPVGLDFEQYAQVMDRLDAVVEAVSGPLLAVLPDRHGV